MFLSTYGHPVHVIDAFHLFRKSRWSLNGTRTKLLQDHSVTEDPKLIKESFETGFRIWPGPWSGAAWSGCCSFLLSTSTLPSSSGHTACPSAAGPLSLYLKKNKNTQHIQIPGTSVSNDKSGTRLLGARCYRKNNQWLGSGFIFFHEDLTQFVGGVA